MDQPIIYTELEIRRLSDIAFSAIRKYMIWEQEYNTKIKKDQKEWIIKLQTRK